MAKTKNEGASSLLKKLKKISTIEESCIFSDSDFYTSTDYISTPIPLINLVLSGHLLSGGISRGSTVVAGESRTFKTMTCLLCLKAFLDSDESAVGLLYDSEFSFSPEYLKTFGIDIERVFITPITDLDSLRNDIIPQIDAIEKGEKVFILIDSLGNLASIQEIKIAQDGKTTQDMSRARALKGLMRMITPRINLKNIPLFTVNHVYKEMISLYPKTVVSGGSGVMLSANTVLIFSRRKGKDEDEESYEFVIKIEKSRSIKDNKKVVLVVPKDGLIKKWSGMFDLALEYGYITSEKQGWYTAPALDGIGNVRRKALENNDVFWNRMFTESNFVEVVEKDFCVSQDQRALFNDIEDEAEELLGNVPDDSYNEENKENNAD